jgi:hypothetical protein
LFLVVVVPPVDGPNPPPIIIAIIPFLFVFNFDFLSPPPPSPPDDDDDNEVNRSIVYNEPDDRQERTGKQRNAVTQYVEIQCAKKSKQDG